MVLYQLTPRIKKEAAKKEAKLEIYFHQTKNELNGLHEILLEWIKKIETYQKFYNAHMLKNAPAFKIITEAKEWAPYLQTHLEIIHEILAEEFALIDEDFPQDIMDDVRDTNNEISRLLQLNRDYGFSYLSIRDSIISINLYASKEDSYQYSKLSDEIKYLISILDDIKNTIERLHKKLSIDENLERKERLAVQQLLGNQYLKNHSATFQNWWEIGLAAHFKGLLKEKKITSLPKFSVTTSSEKEDRKISYNLTAPVFFLTIIIVIDDNPFKLTLNYDSLHDKFFYSTKGFSRSSYAQGDTFSQIYSGEESNLISIFDYILAHAFLPRINF